MTLLRGLVLVLAALFTLLVARIVVGKALGDYVLARAEADYIEVFGALPEALPPPPEAIEMPVALHLTPRAREALRAVERGATSSEQLATIADIALPGTEPVPIASADPTRWLDAARLRAARGWIAFTRADALELEREAAAIVDLTVDARSHPFLIGTLVAIPVEAFWHRLARAAVQADPATGSWVDAGLTKLDATPDLAAVTASELAHSGQTAADFVGEMTKGLAMILPWRAAHFRADALIAWTNFIRRVRSPEPWVDLPERHIAPPPGAWLDPMSVPGISGMFMPTYDPLGRGERRTLSARRITRCGLLLRTSGAAARPPECAGLELTPTATGVQIVDPAKLPEVDKDRERELLRWELVLTELGPGTGDRGPGSREDTPDLGTNWPTRAVRGLIPVPDT